MYIGTFYRSTPMHSADYAVARCASVCLSVTRRYRVETAEHVINPFPSQAYSHTIIVYRTKPYGSIPFLLYSNVARLERHVSMN